MAAKLTKLLWSTSLRLHSPFLGVYFKKCHLQATRRIPAITPSLSYCTARFSTQAASERSDEEHEVTQQRLSEMPRPLTIITESDDSYKIPKAADSHRSESIFDDQLTNKFVNCMMYDGKKSTSQKIFNEALKTIKQKQLEIQKSSNEPDSIVTDPVVIFHQAVENVKPIISCIPQRKTGRVFQVPCPLKPPRRQFFAIQWIINAARKKGGSKNARMSQQLAKELLDAYNNEGAAIKKKQDIHKTAEANRAFAHYRWW